MELPTRSPANSQAESQCTGKSDKTVGQNQVGRSKTRNSTLAKGQRGSAEAGNASLASWALLALRINLQFTKTHEIGPVISTALR